MPRPRLTGSRAAGWWTCPVSSGRGGARAPSCARTRRRGDLKVVDVLRPRPAATTCRASCARRGRRFRHQTVQREVPAHARREDGSAASKDAQDRSDVPGTLPTAHGQYRAELEQGLLEAFAVTGNCSAPATALVLGAGEDRRTPLDSKPASTLLRLQAVLPARWRKRLAALPVRPSHRGDRRQLHPGDKAGGRGPAPRHRQAAALPDHTFLNKPGPLDTGERLLDADPHHHQVRTRPPARSPRQHFRSRRRSCTSPSGHRSGTTHGCRWDGFRVPGTTRR